MTRHEDVNVGCAPSEASNWLNEDEDMSTHADNETATPRYANERYEQFCREAEAAGYEVEHYRGRFFYEGPAIRCDELQDGLRATSVPCQHDNMGHGWIVYPR